MILWEITISGGVMNKLLSWLEVLKPKTCIQILKDLNIYNYIIKLSDRSCVFAVHHIA